MKDFIHLEKEEMAKIEKSIHSSRCKKTRSSSLTINGTSTC